MPMSDYWDRPNTNYESVNIELSKKDTVDKNDKHEKHAIAEEIYAVRKQLSDNVYMRIMEILANL